MVNLSSTHSTLVPCNVHLCGYLLGLVSSLVNGHLPDKVSRALVSLLHHQRITFVSISVLGIVLSVLEARQLSKIWNEKANYKDIANVCGYSCYFGCWRDGYCICYCIP